MTPEPNTPTVTIDDQRLHQVFAQYVKPALPALLDGLGAEPSPVNRELFDAALTAVFLVGAREAMVELSARLVETKLLPDLDVAFAGDLRFDGSELQRLLEGLDEDADADLP